MVYALPAQAVDWRFEPRVGAAATYTDNVKRSSSNPENALILSVTPGFSLRSEGSRRIRASLQYGLTGVTRFGGESDNDLFHNLNATGKAELVEDFLFLDGSAHVSQELISLLGSTADASTNSSNRATVGTYSLSPYIRKRLGTFATGQARYTASGAIFENNVGSSSNVNAFTASLISGTRFNDFSWGLDYSIRKAENRNATNTTFERTSANVGYALSRKFRVFGSVGQDSNEYLSRTATDGSSYSVGFGWAPSRRTNVEAAVGKRYFGRTYSLSGSHRTRLSQWNVRYSEDVSDITQQILAQSGRTYWKCPKVGGGNTYRLATDTTQQPAPNCEGPYLPFELIDLASPLELEALASSLDARGDIGVGRANGIYIIKSFTAGTTWDIGRLGFGLAAQDTKRLYQLLGDAQDHIQSVTGLVSYRMTPHTTAQSSLSLTRNTFDSALTGAAGREDEILTLSLGLNHRFAEKLNGALTFRHTQRDSNAANSNYDENSLTATANMRF